MDIGEIRILVVLIEFTFLHTNGSFIPIGLVLASWGEKFHRDRE